jgi:hypothetical protein
MKLVFLLGLVSDHILVNKSGRHAGPRPRLAERCKSVSEAINMLEELC